MSDDAPEPSPHTLSAEDRRRLDELLADVQKNSSHFAGYPCPNWFDYSELAPFLNYPINNIGDPFAPSTYRVTTRAFEREVLAWFAKLYHIADTEYWGYCTNGGTEGNMYGMFLARELYPSGMVYYSEDTHYSVAKSLRVLNMRHIMIKSQPSGEVDYDDLRETLRIHRDVPPILFTTAGTTMTEAKDDVLTIRGIVRDLAIPEAYIHCDAALCGMTLPFLDGAPSFDFRAGIDSIAVSGHKFIGAPMPCGVVLARKRNVDRIARSIEYIGTLDTTLSGSRNGLSALMLWYSIRKRGVDGFRRDAAECVEKAAYAVRRMQERGIGAWRNPCSLTVVFPRPPARVVDKWQIATSGGRAHMITMPTMTREMIDQLVEDVAAASGGPEEPS